MDATHDFYKGMLMGLRYLITEAEVGNQPKVGQILMKCMRDVSIALENDEDAAASGEAPVVDNELYAAIEFLCKYALVKDENIKRAVKAHIEAQPDLAADGTMG